MHAFCVFQQALLGCIIARSHRGVFESLPLIQDPLPSTFTTDPSRYNPVDSAAANPSSSSSTGGVGVAEEGGAYRPKVTTWGVFPRPADISKAYGGGRNIKPGQELESKEQKAEREVRGMLVA